MWSKVIDIFWVYIWGYQLDVRFGSLLGCLQIIFSLKSLSLSLKSYMNVLCALKLTELWNTSLLFDLHYKFINGNLAFSPG